MSIVLVTVIGYALLTILLVGAVLMIFSARRLIIEEIRALKLRMMHRPESIKGKSRINKVG